MSPGRGHAATSRFQCCLPFQVVLRHATCHYAGQVYRSFVIDPQRRLAKPHRLRDLLLSCSLWLERTIAEWKVCIFQMPTMPCLAIQCKRAES